MTQPQLSPATLAGTHERVRVLEQLGSECFDVLIVGGGVTGAGLASAGARQGLRVALCEASDFAAGTSSRSSKLIHGGLRYLESFEFRLVRKTARERKEIHEQAPHLAEPRWMLAPHRSFYDRIVLSMGVGLYERLGAVESEDRKRLWSQKILEERAPGLDRLRYPQAIAYREYTTDDARLVLALMRDACGHGAVALNHLALEGTGERNEGDIHVRLRDHVSDAAIVVRAKQVVNAAGPWVDDVLKQGLGSQERIVQLSRGIHIVVPARRLPIADLLMLHAVDGRRFFVMRRGDVVHIGTTDVPQAGKAQYWPKVSAREIHYLLDSVNQHFPGVGLVVGDIVGAWSGLRPLVRRHGGQVQSPGKVSRADEIIDHGNGIWTIAGGKLTGYPGMARSMLARMAPALGRTIRELTQRASQPLPGGAFSGSLETLQSEIQDEFPELPAAVIHRLVRFYGSESRDVLALDASLVPGCPEICLAELRWAFRVEGAVSLEDVLYRRIRLFYYLAIEVQQAPDRIRAIGIACGQIQRWSAARLELELEAAMDVYRRETNYFRNSSSDSFERPTRDDLRGAKRFGSVRTTQKLSR